MTWGDYLTEPPLPEAILIGEDEVSDAMLPGHVALPNGFGLRPPGDGAGPGVAPNELTSSHWRDPLAGDKEAMILDAS